MLSLNQIRANALYLEPNIENLRVNMTQYLRAKQRFRIINVRIWFDGSLQIRTNSPVRNQVLKDFQKEYDLEGHFIKEEGPLSCFYDFVYTKDKRLKVLWEE